jgi:hypothetical protein
MLRDTLFTFCPLRTFKLLGEYFPVWPLKVNVPAVVPSDTVLA